MKPFVLADALAGKPVVNKIGDAVSVTKLAAVTNCGMALISQDPEGKILAYHRADGTAEYGSLGGGFNLFMKSTEKTIFINLWDSPSFHYTMHQSAGEATAASGQTYTGRRFKKLNSVPIAIVIEE